MNRAAVSHFFAYARARESIRRERAAGNPPPWTVNKVLQEFRFCNVCREDDKVTRWIAENVRRPLDESPHVLMAMIICRFINRIESLSLIDDVLREGLGNWGAARVKLEKRLADVSPLVTGAYVVKTPPGMNKLQGLLWIFDQMGPSEAEHYCTHLEPGETTLEALQDALTQYQYLGAFMAYEVVTDMRHTSWMRDPPDVLTWASVGPGAARGLSRVMVGLDQPNHFLYTSARDQQAMLVHMRSLLLLSRDTSLWPYEDRPWEMREVEHTLCEFDKYQRVRLGEGQPKQRYKTS